MRWKAKKKNKPRTRDTRICEGFLLLPYTIGNETRWWEHARWEEMWFSDSDCWPYGGWWEDTRWIEEWELA